MWTTSRLVTTASTQYEYIEILKHSQEKFCDILRIVKICSSSELYMWFKKNEWMDELNYIFIHTNLWERRHEDTWRHIGKNVYVVVALVHHKCSKLSFEASNNGTKTLP